MELESNYPYVAKTESCKAKASEEVLRVVSHSHVKKNSISALKSAIRSGPTGVSVDAKGSIFHGYKSGILNNCNGGNHLDHAIVAVGYGTDGHHGKYYAIVRNSWKSSWGESGYIRMSLEDQGDEGVCGILMDPKIAKTE